MESTTLYPLADSAIARSPIAGAGYPTHLATSWPNLRDYQKETVEQVLRANGRFGIWHDPGLGKTAPAVFSARLLTSGEILIVAPKVAFGSWMKQTPTWIGENPTLWWGPEEEKERLWREYKRERRARDAKAGILLTNYHSLPQLLKRQSYWGAIIFDESHIMRNHRASFFQNAKKLVSRYVIQLTGSPIVNGVDDLWAQMNLLDEKTFSNFYKWEATYNKMYSVPGMGKRKYGVKNMDHMRALTKPLYIRRHKDDVLKELPPKVRDTVEYDLTPRQRELYYDLAEDWITTLGDGTTLIAPNTLARLVRLRQVLISPKLIGDTNIESGILSALREVVSLEFDARRPVAIFTPYAKAIPLIQNVLCLGRNPLVPETVVIQGGLSPAELKRRQDYFMDPPRSLGPDSWKTTLIATIQSATSYDAYRASTAIFLGQHWQPTANEQSEDRLHRLGQTDSVRCIYLVAPNTVDEHIIDILDRKTTYQALAVDLHKLLFPRGRPPHATYLPDNDWRK